MQKIINHLPHYLPLFGILVMGTIGFVYFSYDDSFQTVVAFALASSYVAWGIAHHKIHRDLYLEVIFEYIIVAILGLAVLLLI